MSPVKSDFSDLLSWDFFFYENVYIKTVLTPSQVLICLSLSLSGTTWMQEIVTLILNKGDPHLSQTVPNWARAPWLEQHHFAAFLKTSPITPRLITTHLPYHLLGPALRASKTKVRLRAETVGLRVDRG